MQAVAITGLDDIRRIERQPYAAFMPHQGLLQALQAGAAQHGDRPALRYIDGPEADAAHFDWTHAQLLDEVRRAANLFHALAAPRAPRVAVLVPALPQAHIALWGAELAGVACPINFLLQDEHLAELLRATGANIAVALDIHPQLDIGPRVRALQASCPELRHVLMVDVPGSLPDPAGFDAQRALQRGDALDFVPDERPDRVVALFHTGGTTGAPKLAQHTAANQLHAAWGAACHYGLDARDVMLTGFPLFHVAGAFVFGLSTLLAGGCVLLPTVLGLRNPALVAGYWQVVQQQRVTLLAAVPTVMAMLLAVPPAGADLRRVRALLTGGSPLPPELAAAFEQQTGIPVRNILGMTECAGVISIEPLAAPRVPGSCGWPLPFTRVVAVGADGHALPAGATGVLRISGPHVGPGYTDPARSAGTWADDGALLSGDLGHVGADGLVFVTGRAKDVIIRSSHNIDPEVIENALLRLPAVQMAAAVGEPDDHAGELPVAFVVLKPGAQASAQALLDGARPHIPVRPAWPRRVVVLPALPLTAIGKVYKPALRRLAAEQVLRDRLQRQGLDGDVQVEVSEAAGGLQVCFRSRDASRHEAVRLLMRGFALTWRFDAV